MFFPGPLFGLGCLIFYFILAAACGYLKSFGKLMIGLGIPVILVLIFVQGFFGTRNETVLIDFGFATLGLEGTIYALHTSFAILVLVGGFQIFLEYTYIGELIADLTDRGVSPTAGYLVLACFNVVPQMQQKLATIQEAQTARGFSNEGNIISRLKGTIVLIAPVILSSILESSERAMTLETHGFGLPGKHTSYIAVHHTSADTPIIILSVVLVVVAVIANIVL